MHVVISKNENEQGHPSSGMGKTYFVAGATAGTKMKTAHGLADI